MQTIESITALREQIKQWRRAELNIALVPTMGALHDGHLSLITVARQYAERVIVSIFVNPLQFGPQEDFTRYPRPLEHDLALLTRAGVAAVFIPPVTELYPAAAQTQVRVSQLATQLCGVTRPALFDGVATIVTKLFNIAQPDYAVFGEKDYQQLVLIRRMVTDLNIPVQIIGAPTIRAADGLALSSRNAYLTPAERAIAPQLYAVLQQATQSLQTGMAIESVEQTARAVLIAHGLRPDYVSVRRADDLELPTASDQLLVILAAAYLGTARLIDNVTVTRA